MPTLHLQGIPRAVQPINAPLIPMYMGEKCYSAIGIVFIDGFCDEYLGLMEIYLV